MEEKIKQRNSNIELLRIICMVLIIFHHYSVHGNFQFTENIMSINRILINIISLGGKLACDIFILIMGYFMIESKFNGKKVLKIIIKMFTYAYLIMAIVYGFNLIDFNMKVFLKELLPIFYGNWFIIFYIMMYIISPFINTMLKSLSKERFKTMILTIILIWSVIPTLIPKSGWNFSDIDAFIVMYIIGAYLRLHTTELKDKTKNRKNAIIALICILLIILSSVIILILGYKLNISLIIDNSTYFSGISSILVVIASIFIFQYFRNLNITSKKINYIASSMLGVYLIHDNVLMRHLLWEKLSPNVNYINSNLLIVHAIIKVISIFIICILIDKIVTKILDLTINKIINNIQIPIRLKKIENKTINRLLKK